MRSKLLSVFFVICIILVINYLFFLINVAFGVRVRFSILYFILNTILIFLFFEILIYNTLFTLNSAKFKILFFIVVPFLFSMHLTERLLAIDKLYFYLKSLTIQDSHDLWQADPYLAHKGIPDSEGSLDYYIGDSIRGSISVIFDDKGFRTVSDSFKIKSDTTDLYLGCSMTFGDYIPAEEGYPYRTSKLLNHGFINAAASGYGLGQMKHLLDSLLAYNKFNYVFIQLSPWLVDRAMKINGPTTYGKIPFPYFSDDGDNFVLNKVAFKSNVYSVKPWRLTSPSCFDKILFMFSDGFKIEVANFYSHKWASVKVILGLKPKPTKRKRDLEYYFYSYAINYCIQNDAIPVIIKLWYPDEECHELKNYLGQDVLIIDLDIELDKKIKETGRDFRSLFWIYHVQNNDTIIFENHPNGLANELFSQRIYSELKRE